MSDKATKPASGLGGSATPPEPGEVKDHIVVPDEGNDDEGREPGSELPIGSPEGLKEAAGGKLKEHPDDPDSQVEASAKEAGALDFMLSNPSPASFTVEALMDTPAGLKPLTFHMHQLDGNRIEALENEHTDGVGAWATVDRLKLNAAKIAEATDKMVDANGKEIVPTDPAFIGDAIAPVIAFERMFALQPGVGDQLAEQINRMAGLSRDRVGMAEREMTNAVGNS